MLTLGGLPNTVIPQGAMLCHFLLSQELVCLFGMSVCDMHYKKVKTALLKSKLERELSWAVSYLFSHYTGSCFSVKDEIQCTLA